MTRFKISVTFDTESSDETIRLLFQNLKIDLERDSKKEDATTKLVSMSLERLPTPSQK